MIKLRTGDTLPPLVIELYWSDGTPIDLTNANTVTLELRDLSGNLVYIGSCTIVDATAGKIQHDWGDTSSLNGVYIRQIVITFLDGSKVTMPSDKIEFIMFW